MYIKGNENLKFWNQVLSVTFCIQRGEILAFRVDNAVNHSKPQPKNERQMDTSWIQWLKHRIVIDLIIQRNWKWCGLINTGHAFLDLILVKLRSNWFSNCFNSSMEHGSNPTPTSFLQIVQVFSCLLQQVMQWDYTQYISKSSLKPFRDFKILDLLGQSKSIFLHRLHAKSKTKFEKLTQ